MDVEGTMQFILEQQASFTNDVSRINGVLLDLANAQARTNEILATLAKRQFATEEAIRGLAERQSTTEETLNTLMLTVERHIANHS